MTLYHNCDYRDLSSILTGNNRWDNGKRVNNSEDVVYLFKPVGKQNSFTQYGICLIEVETDATENVLDEADCNHGKYAEYVTEYVPTNQIKAVYIPEVFKDKVASEFDLETLAKITWCDFYAEEIDGYVSTGFCEGYSTYKRVSEERLSEFVRTAELKVDGFNYFRGIDDTRCMIDLYNISYGINH